MEVALSALIGFGFGAIFAVINHLMLANAFKKLSTENQKGDTKLIGRVYIIRYVINLAALFAVFIFREKLPYQWEYILIFTAIGLTLPARLLAMKSGFNDRVKGGFGTSSDLAAPKTDTSGGVDNNANNK